MNYIHALIFSIVEGITEFLPISSTGHLILVSKLLNIPQTEFVKSFEIFIQLGAICAVVFLYWKDFLKGLTIWKPVIVAFIPTGILGLVFYKVVKHFLLGNVLVTVAALLIGGILLIVIEKMHAEKNEHISRIEQVSLKTALFIGLFQSLSMIPGVSRAAATIIGALLLGTKRKTAVEFSFLLAVPTMLAATGLDLVKSDFHFSSYEFSLLAVGFIGSFIVAILAIKFLLKFVQNHTFIPFGIYRIVLAILFFLFVLRL